MVKESGLQQTTKGRYCTYWLEIFSNGYIFLTKQYKIDNEF